MPVGPLVRVEEGALHGRAGHFGLRGLSERVRQLGGTFSVGNHADRGVRLSADIPLGKPA